MVGGSSLGFGGRLPAMRQQVFNLTGTLRRQPWHHIFQIGVRVIPIELGRLGENSSPQPRVCRPYSALW